jgi:hypothetical protein
MLDFTNSPWFWGPLIVLLLALIGVFFYVRRSQSED